MMIKKLIITGLILGIVGVCSAGDYSSGDKFLSKDGYVIELINRVSIYADDDRCLSMMRQGYLIYCEPIPVGWKWEIVVQSHGVNVTSWINENDLCQLKKQSNHTEGALEKNK